MFISLERTDKVFDSLVSEVIICELVEVSGKNLVLDLTCLHLFNEG